MWLLKIALIVSAILVAAGMYFLYVMQTRMLFPADLVGPSQSLLPSSAVSLEIDGPGGNRLHGIHIPPTGEQSGERLTILGFGGNAWSAASMAEYLHGLFPDNDVVAFYYRGYHPSTGQPSAAALLADAPLIHDHVLKNLGGEQVVAVGFSLGTGVPAYLASRRQLAGVILISPFDSLKALAREHYPWAPVGLLLRHHMPAANSIHGLNTPIAIIAAERDTIIPPSRTETLRQAVSHLVFDRAIAQADHNDLYQRVEFHEAMKEALTHIRAATDNQRREIN
jgi:uncharacterized protein